MWSWLDNRNRYGFIHSPWSLARAWARRDFDIISIYCLIKAAIDQLQGNGMLMFPHCAQRPATNK